MLQSTIPNLRYKVLAAAMAAVLLLLVGRLWELQVTQWPKYAKSAASTRLTSEWQPAPRGTIYDRQGQVLADNRATWNVNLRPADFPTDQAKAEKVIQQLAAILEHSTAEVRRAIEAIKQSGATVDSAPLKDIGEDVPLRVVAQIQERSYDLPGVTIEEVLQRFYPQGELACHVLGYARTIDPLEYERVRQLNVPPGLSSPGDPTGELIREPAYPMNAVFGKAGIEQVCELDTSRTPPVPLLQGVRGRTRYEKTITNEPLGSPVDQREPIPGATVYLTLDAHIQQVAEHALRQAIAGGRRRVGAAVLLDCNTGEVLALASVPGYDLNKWVRGWKPDEMRELTENPRKPQIDYSIAGLYAPGSCFKLVSSAAALSTTSVSTSTSYTCNGVIIVGRQPYHCWSPGGHGSISFYQALAQSCDVYFYDLARLGGLSAENIAEYAKRFGLGQVTGLELPGEKDGLVPTPQWKENVLRQRWTLGDKLNMVIGQGYLNVTPLQMARVTAAFANGGKLVTPHLIKRVVWPAYTGRGAEEKPPPPSTTVQVDPQVLQKVRQGMRLACSAPRGTAAGIFRDFPVAVAGKTGSSQHRLDRPTHAWFVAFAPYDHPKYAVAVLVAEGGHGGSTAAPVARDILAAALGLKMNGPAVGQGPSD